MSRWERRAVEAEQSGDEAALLKSMVCFEAAVNDVAERSEWDPQWKAVPPPSRAAEFTDDYLSAQADDTLEQQWNGLHFDPRAQALIEAEWDRRAAAEALRAEQEDAEIRELWEATLAPDCVRGLEDSQLQDMWSELHAHRDLQEKVEAEWDRRAVEAAGPELSGAQIEELEWAYNNLSPAKYREVERRLITDPSLWTSEGSDGTPVAPTGTVKDAQERERLAYFEYQFERYIAAEGKCRGHMLNKRGQALGVDAQSLMYGNAKRMSAYASAEFKAAIGGSGGHMSFARFSAMRGARSRPSYGVHNAETFQDVAHV